MSRWDDDEGHSDGGTSREWEAAAVGEDGDEELVDAGERLVVSNSKLDVRLLPGELIVAHIKSK